MRSHPSQVPSSAESDFDESVLLAQVGFDRVLFRVVLETFRDEWPRRARGLMEGVQVADWDTVVRQAHTLKGSLRQIGASRAARAAERVEHLARAADAAALEEAVPAAESALGHVDAEIAELLRNEA